MDRKYFLAGADPTEINGLIFCDASDMGACGAVVYFRRKKKCKISLRMAKPRVTPLKSLTLPHLE